MKRGVSPGLLGAMLVLAQGAVADAQPRPRSASGLRCGAGCHEVELRVQGRRAYCPGCGRIYQQSGDEWLSRDVAARRA